MRPKTLNRGASDELEARRDYLKRLPASALRDKILAWVNGRIRRAKAKESWV